MEMTSTCTIEIHQKFFIGSTPDRHETKAQRVAQPCCQRNGGLQPCRGVSTPLVVSRRQNLHMYMTDLLKTATSWAIQHPSGVIHVPNVFAQSRDWEWVAPPRLKPTPRYADSTVERRMVLSPNFHPHTGIASPNASIASSTTYPYSEIDGLLWFRETSCRG